MSIDVFHENVLTLSQASKKLPRIRRGRTINISTLHRWVEAGLKGGDGSVVRLETIKIGGATCTSQEALQRFFERLQCGEPGIERVGDQLAGQAVSRSRAATNRDARLV